MIGCDIVEINRLEAAYNKHGDAFVNRILTPKEKALFKQRKSRFAFFAGRFAAKEAVVKALGTGIGDTGFQDIEILPDDKGAPVLTIKGKKLGSISISHENKYAMAVCLLV